LDRILEVVGVGKEASKKILGWIGGFCGV